MSDFDLIRNAVGMVEGQHLAEIKTLTDENAALKKIIADLEASDPQSTHEPLMLLEDGASATIGGKVYKAQSPGQSYSLLVSPDPAPTMAVFELRAGDRWSGDIVAFPNDNRQRSELREMTYCPFNTDVWMAGSCWVDYQTLKSGGYNILTQFHQQDMGSPPLGMSITDGKLSIYSRGSATTAAGVSSSWINMAAPVREWMNWVWRMRFTNGTQNGQLQVWLNGTQLFNRSNIWMGYNSANKPYQKFGIYRSGHTDRIQVKWANREISTTSLLSRVASPLPI